VDQSRNHFLNDSLEPHPKEDYPHHDILTHENVTPEHVNMMRGIDHVFADAPMIF
jgi:hypothetical protein